MAAEDAPTGTASRPTETQRPSRARAPFDKRTDVLPPKPVPRESSPGLGPPGVGRRNGGCKGPLGARKHRPSRLRCQRDNPPNGGPCLLGGHHLIAFERAFHVLAAAQVGVDRT